MKGFVCSSIIGLTNCSISSMSLFLSIELTSLIQDVDPPP